MVHFVLKWRKNGVSLPAALIEALPKPAKTSAIHPSTQNQLVDQCSNQAKQDAETFTAACLGKDSCG
jgi:hypothetical protein